MASDAPRRIVFDTNALVSAFLFPNSLPGRALDVVLAEHQLLMSLAIAGELTEVLHREKFDAFLSVERRDELLAGAIRESEFIEPTTVITACRDPHDNKFLN